MDSATTHIVEIGGFVIALSGVVITMYQLNAKSAARLAKIEARQNVMFKWFVRHIIQKGDRDEPS